MGEYTSNGWFYKPDLGAKGKVEKDKFDAALENIDAVLKDLDDFASLAEKSSPASTDLLIIEDSVDSYNKKKIQIDTLPGGAVVVEEVIEKSDSGALTINDLDKTILCTNTAGMNLNLPSVSATEVGKRLTLVKASDQELKLTAADSDKIGSSGEGGYIFNDQALEKDVASVTIRLLTATQWFIVAKVGTWYAV
ncbi:MAG: hypothetical protein PHW74_06285 [Desulfobacca sp.]|nr:hypothetical protein [Desulfobacca sp.]